MRHGSEVGFGEKSVEGARAGIPALRYHIAGHCFQFVSGIFPHFAARGWFWLQLAWQQNRLARSHSRFPQLFTAWEPGNCFGLPDDPRARPMEVCTAGMGWDPVGGFSSDEAADGWH